MVVVLIIAILIAIALPTFLGLRERAQNRAAQSNLRNGLAAAKAYFTDFESYDPAGAEVFNAAEGDAIEPSLDWVNGTAPTTGQLGVVTASVDQNTLQLVALSASGDWYCIQDDAGVTGYGGFIAANTAAAVTAACGNAAWVQA
jgi:type IV pilus assembly protein PilA